MEPTFIYYSNLTFNSEKKFSINFSDEDWLEGVVFKKNKDYYITSMTCHVDLTPNYAKIKQTSDLVNAILRGSIDFGYGRKELTLGKTSRSNLKFRSDKLEEIDTSKTLNFFILKIKKHKTYIFIQHTKS